jgi:hypothetical protein
MFVNRDSLRQRPASAELQHAQRRLAQAEESSLLSVRLEAVRQRFRVLEKEHEAALEATSSVIATLAVAVEAAWEAQCQQKFEEAHSGQLALSRVLERRALRRALEHSDGKSARQFYGDQIDAAALPPSIVQPSTTRPATAVRPAVLTRPSAETSGGSSGIISSHRPASASASAFAAVQFAQQLRSAVSARPCSAAISAKNNPGGGRPVSLREERPPLAASRPESALGAHGKASPGLLPMAGLQISNEYASRPSDVGLRDATGYWDVVYTAQRGASAGRTRPHSAAAAGTHTASALSLPVAFPTDGVKRPSTTTEPRLDMSLTTTTSQHRPSAVLASSCFMPGAYGNVLESTIAPIKLAAERDLMCFDFTDDDDDDSDIGSTSDSEDLDGATLRPPSPDAVARSERKARERALRATEDYGSTLQREKLRQLRREARAAGLVCTDPQQLRAERELRQRRLQAFRQEKRAEAEQVQRRGGPLEISQSSAYYSATTTPYPRDSSSFAGFSMISPSGLVAVSFQHFGSGVAAKRKPRLTRGQRIAKRAASRAQDSLARALAQDAASHAASPTPTLRPLDPPPEDAFAPDADLLLGSMDSPTAPRDDTPLTAPSRHPDSPLARNATRGLHFWCTRKLSPAAPAPAPAATPQLAVEGHPSAHIVLAEETSMSPLTTRGFADASPDVSAFPLQEAADQLAAADRLTNRLRRKLQALEDPLCPTAALPPSHVKEAAPRKTDNVSKAHAAASQGLQALAAFSIWDATPTEVSTTTNAKTDARQGNVRAARAFVEQHIRLDRDYDEMVKAAVQKRLAASRGRGATDEHTKPMQCDERADTVSL